MSINKVETAATDRPTANRRPIKRALISVFNKEGLTELATALHNSGVTIVSTGSTATAIKTAGVPVTLVEQVTGSPEILEGRVKTLHPAIHAGLLADTRKDTHLTQLADLDIQPFDLVVGNLYPFSQLVGTGLTNNELVEQVDIGGPAMLRAAAKNHASVAAVLDPEQYDQVIAALNNGGFTRDERRKLAAKVFETTAEYDADVARWLTHLVDSAANSEETEDIGDIVYSDPGDDSFDPADAEFVAVDADSTGTTTNSAAAAGRRATIASELSEDASLARIELRYGENPHQKAALIPDGSGSGLANAQLLQGKPMSFNNYVDADAAWRAAWDQLDPAVAIVKHANPCGIAAASDIADAYHLAFATDPVSAYGSVVAANRTVTGALAEQMAKVFTEVIVAPGYTPEALATLAAKKNLRVLEAEPPGESPQVEERRISGGLLIQDTDRYQAEGDDPANWTQVAGPKVEFGEASSADLLADLAFAWRAVRAAKSNAILLARDGAAIGIGMGQVNRVDSCRLAVGRAAEFCGGAEGSVAASDAFFPFADGLEILLDAGVRAVVEPGGSVRDAEVIAAADAAGVPLFFTGVRHFYH